MAANLTTAELLTQGARRLAGSSETPELDAELLLAHVLGTSRTRLKSHPEEPRTAAEYERFEALVARRASGEPLAYIVGYRDFWSIRVAVSPAVLVPRPETELLVERALALRAEPFGQAADLGTGSGAIALALATERPGWEIVATDVSAQALDVARANAAALRLRNVQFIEASWFGSVPRGSLDLIVSNPPYVAAGDPALRQPQLRCEPQLALTPGEDALAALRLIVHSAPEYLRPGGWLLLEHGPTQAAGVARELVARGFRHVRSHRDLAQHERMTEARWG